ncbi:MAG: flagellar motor protein MotB [Rhodospirillales bacterium]|nr:flagellar motor protein MotB [Rhodospirillales bacterium]
MAEKGGSVVIKRIKKGGHGHHGGAWKVAYADFVTAMMAFFLLLWLLNAVPKETLSGISQYFAPISTKSKTSGGVGMLSGRTIKNIAVPQPDVPITPQVSDSATAQVELKDTDDENDQPLELSKKELNEQWKKHEEQQFKEAERQLHDAIGEDPDLRGLSKSLVVDDTPEGLRIQIIDQEGLPMFPRGDSQMFAHTRKVLELVAKVIMRMPQDIDITGHTDATRYQTESGYSNWELSADRANAARRALLQYGVPEDRIARVIGKAATDPLIAGDPSAPGNRRLSVVLLRGTGEKR